jgi:hypothetical protein
MLANESFRVVREFRFADRVTGDTTALQPSTEVVRHTSFLARNDDQLLSEVQPE